MEIGQKILQQITDKHNSSAGHCGISFQQLQTNNSLNSKELKAILNQLHKEKKITTYQGIHNKLIKILK